MALVPGLVIAILAAWLGAVIFFQLLGLCQILTAALP